MDLSFFEQKKILITGHTGFKGSWLVKLLDHLGAEVYGYALAPGTSPSLFEELGLEKAMGDRSFIGDIRDLERLKAVFSAVQPELVIHLAAQPIVRESYEHPVYTYETNVMGTVHVMECVRFTPSVRSVLNVTTDKVYENRETGQAYKEDDRLDGYDPYSNSKSCSELVTHSYRQSFLNDLGIPVSTARAGNVIGGGDYARDRIIPDCVRAALKGEAIVLRNPYSIRPYQHVLEPLYVYLSILEGQYLHPELAGSYNVGPDAQDCISTGEIADLFVKAWGRGLSWVSTAVKGPHEAGFLQLDNTKVKETFSWKPVWNVEKAVNSIVEYALSEDKEDCVRRQIEAFLKEAAHV